MFPSFLIRILLKTRFFLPGFKADSTTSLLGDALAEKWHPSLK